MADTGYSAGNLFLGIEAEANNTLKTLDAVIERLEIISNSPLMKKGGSKIAEINLGKSNQKMLGGLLKIGSWTAVFHTARRLGKVVANIVQSGSDYTETLNLWQVAMRDNLDMADEFVNKINKAYGISSKTVMNAQATFKNMIGSLGQIDDATAYKLSEALVQMSADFSSLYNVKLESAFNKMQAMLAGQVRPIRSAGLDMTETTLYQYYQAIGGTKSMRQLNRTEKQLLSILTVYQQMGSAGALGDMSKTLNQFANQSRMMTEYWAELKTWTGLILKDFLDQGKVLIYINASLITMTEIVKAIAKSRGLGEESFIDGMFETTEATNEEIDELQGKLLDFDKFRSLDQGQVNFLGIDQKLLEALSGYSSKIDEAKNEAQELANGWLKALGFIEGSNGELEITQTNLDYIIDKIQTGFGLISAISGIIFGKKAFGNTWISLLVGAFAYAYTTNEQFRESINNIATELGESLIPVAQTMIDVLADIVEFAEPFIIVIADILKLVDASGLLEPILYGIATVFLTIKAIKFSETIAKITEKIIDFSNQTITLGKTLDGNLKPIQNQKLAFEDVAIAIEVAMGSYLLMKSVLDGLQGEDKKFAAWAMVIVGALMAIATAAAIANGALTMGVGLAIAGASIGAFVAGIEALAPSIEYHARGASDIDGGTLFVAGEMGKTEAVYTGSNGKTNVANVKQMEQAFYNALQRHASEGNEPIIIQAYLDGEKVYENTTSRARAKGQVWAKV